MAGEVAPYLAHPRSWWSPDDPLFGHAEPKCRAAAWADLYHLAAHTAHERLVGNALVMVGRGEVVASARYLAERWRWPKTNVQRFLDALERMGRITRKRASAPPKTGSATGSIPGPQTGSKSGSNWATITICGYDAYANPWVGNGPQVGSEWVGSGSEVGQREVKENELDELDEGGGAHALGSSPKPGSAPRPPQSTAKRRARFCPDDWRPNEAHRAKAVTLGLDLDDQVDSFRCHEYAKPKTDWDRAFHTWLRNSAEWGGGRRGATSRTAPSAGAGEGELDWAKDEMLDCGFGDLVPLMGLGQ